MGIIMNGNFSIFFWPIMPFLWHPERALFVVVLLFVLLLVAFLATGRFQARIHGMILTAAILWLLFVLLEYKARADNANVRVDILFTYPILLSVSIPAIWRGLRAILQQPDNSPGTTGDKQ